MTITVDATPKSVTANSFLTLDEANAFFATRLHSEEWENVDDETKKAAIITATQHLNTEEWSGRRETQGQSLSWPRQLCYDRDGYRWENIPTPLKRATCELAYFMLIRDTNDAASPDFSYDTMNTLKSMNAGAAVWNFRDDIEEYPDAVTDQLELLGSAWQDDACAQGFSL